MILASDLKLAIQPLLEAEGTQRFTDRQDYIPAINSALRSANALVGAVFAENKGGEEMFRDITVTRVFQTNGLGGLTMTEAELGHKVWSIAAIYAEPTFLPSSPAILALGEAQSQWRTDVTMATPGKFQVYRTTLEKISQTETNMFMEGNEVLADGPNRSYAYYWVGDRSTTNYQPGDAELVVIPASRTPRTLVGVSYLKGVDPIVDLTASIPYPASIFQILRDLAANDLSIKMGSRPLFDVSLNSVRSLIVASA